MTENKKKSASGSSAPPRQSAGAVRSQPAHKAILDAALEVLEEEGYSGFTIEAVALRARAGKPTIYRWWKSKGALLVEVNERVFASLYELPELGSATEEMEQYLTTVWRILRRHPTTTRGALSAAQHDAEAGKQLRERILVRRRAIVHGILSRGIARGELSSRFDIDTAVDAFLGFSTLRLMINEDVDQQAARNLVQVLLDGMRRKDGAGAG